MELEIKHVAPYLPYDLELIFEKSGRKIKMKSCFSDPNLHILDKLEYNVYDTSIWNFKPILRPLSSIQSYFEPLWDSDIEVRSYLSEEFITGFGFEGIEGVLGYKVEWWPVGFYNILLKHHFDVFGLIEQGLATIKE